MWFLFPTALQAAELSTSATHEPQQSRQYDRLRGVTKGVCAGMFQIVGTNYCTHGPDAPPVGVDASNSVAPVVFAADSQAPSVFCDGDGESGNRVQVIYIRPENQPDRFDEFQQSIQQWMVEVDDIYNASAQETGGTRHIRFVHNTACQVVVLNEVIASNADATFAESISAIQAKGHNRKDRKYLMFVDSTVFCGIGGMYSDETADSSNRNNGGPTYARVDSGCWGPRVAAHELMHNLGGVQFGAPNSSGGYHCTDDWDIMCYSDAPKYPSVTIKCADPEHEIRLDCNHDDYYHTNPPAGNYLATHWNPAFNQFLIWPNQPLPTPTLTASPTPQVAPNCTAYRATELPASIFDQKTTIAVLNVRDSFIINDVNVMNLQIQHTFVADLDAYLISPKGTKVLLFKGVGVNDRDFDSTWLDDEASTIINDGSAPFSGSYRPALPLSALDGEDAKGEWQLHITDTAFRDAGILNGWGLELCHIFSPGATPTPDATQTPTGQATPTPSNGDATATPTPLPPREGSVQLEIILDVAPQTIQNFRFEINGQIILLDDAIVDDDDPYSNHFTAILTEGNYVISEQVPNTWFLENIECTLNTDTELQSAKPEIVLNLHAGDRVICKFHNQRNVIVRTQTFEDKNQNRQFDLNESGLANRTVILYSSTVEELETQESNEFGKANFNGLKSGSYTICQVATEGWQPSNPVTDTAQTKKTCYDALLAPGQIAIARFGNVQDDSVELITPEDLNISGAGVMDKNSKNGEADDGLEITEMPDVVDDDAGYGDEIMQDTDANLPVFFNRVFLPLIAN